MIYKCLANKQVVSLTHTHKHTYTKQQGIFLSARAVPDLLPKTQQTHFVLKSFLKSSDTIIHFPLSQWQGNCKVWPKCSRSLACEQSPPKQPPSREHGAMATLPTGSGACPLPAHYNPDSEFISLPAYTLAHAFFSDFSISWHHPHRCIHPFSSRDNLATSYPHTILI